jgi:hypothetical protein
MLDVDVESCPHCAITQKKTERGLVTETANNGDSDKQCRRQCPTGGYIPVME